MKQADTTVPAPTDDRRRQQITPGEQYRRRLRAAQRSQPLDHSGQRDPELDPIDADRREPSTYGMTPDQLRAYGRYLRSQGWADWEIAARLVDPRILQQQLDAAHEADRICNPWMETAA